MLMLFKELAFDLAFSSYSSLAAKTAYYPLQEIFLTVGEAYFVLQQILVDGPEQFPTLIRKSANTNCFKSRKVVGNMVGY